MRHARPGFALLTLLVILLLSAVLVGLFQLRANRERIRARYALIRRQAFVSCERELWEQRASAADLVVGAWITEAVSRANVSVSVTISRTTDTLFWVTCDAEARDGALVAHHRLGISAMRDPQSRDFRVVPVADRGWTDLF